jgi:hypothetical protein
MKELKNRWKSESPEFWEKIGRIGVGIGVVGGILVSGTIALPATLVTIGGYMVAVGSVTKVLSKLTVKDANNESF